MEKRNRRIGMSVIGVVICGISIGFFKRAELGVDPFQSLMSGLDAAIPISFGTLYVLANLVLIMFALIMDRRKIGLATVINMTLLGYIAQYSQQLLIRIIPDPGVPVRLILLLIGIVVMCIASAFYFTADLGVSTYDAIALILSEKQKKIPFRILRIISDLICVILGILLCLASGFSWKQIGASVGIGTILSAFGMGPLIDFFSIHLARPFLERE
ncbi:MAG: hypothetical protein IJ899_20210 [Blautia sp.]|nr:hypothetical protein [Blautia sp.]